MEIAALRSWADGIFTFGKYAFNASTRQASSEIDPKSCLNRPFSSACAEISLNSSGEKSDTIDLISFGLPTPGFRFCHCEIGMPRDFATFNRVGLSSWVNRFE